MQYKIYKIISALLFCYAVSCNNAGTVTSSAGTGKAKDSVLLFMNSIENNVSANGPAAWLSVFENTPDFFMASDGRLAFKNYDSAKSFINNILIKNIIKISLQWNNIHIQMLSDSLAQVSAGFHEDITNMKDSVIGYNGYFTGLAHNKEQQWKLQNLHWSILKN